MKSKLKFLIVATILYILGIILTIYWCDYKLLIIFFIFQWYQNLANTADKLKH